MSTPPRPLPPKKDVALALLQGPSLFIHLDPRKAEVIVPPHFKKQAQLVLQVGLNMAVPIPDLHVDDDGVSCTLSFNRSPFWCRLPWSAIYALVGDDKRGMIWPDEVPAEVENAQRPKGTEPQAAGPKSRGPRSSKKRERSPREDEARAAGELASSEAAGQGRELRASARPLAPLPVSSRPLSPTASTARTAGVPSTKGTGEATKPGKRELPPYLRVVK
jgi:stringent starvation protein B